MENSVCFFNLIAVLVEEARQFPEYRKTHRLADDDARMVSDCIDGIMRIFFNPSVEDIEKRLTITQQDINDILDTLKDKNFYYFSVLITRLDKLLSPEILYNLLEPDPMSGKDATERYFTSLNDNAEQTGIYIFPNLISESTSKNESGLFTSGKARLENDLKEQLKNIYYVEKEALKDYKINNLVLDCELKDKRNDYITVAVTPLCNTAQNKLMDLYEFEGRDNGMGVKLFTPKLKDPQQLYGKFKNVLFKCNGEGDVDILLGPEVLGTEEFSSVDGLGYNEEIRKIGGKSPPSLIIPPTYVNNSSNVLSVFADSGEKLGEQHKQKPYDNKKSTEDLRNAKREILVLHIRGIGRVCFLICKDFLTEYADILINELKANLILCPSYSEGARRFIASKNIATGHNCKVVWINCCSAFKNRNEKGAFIGFAAGNYIPENTAYLKCSECSECNGCYFKIKIPLHSLSGELYNDDKIELQHKRI